MAGDVEFEALRTAEAFGRGVRTSLTNNASAYGFSVAITCGFGLVSSAHHEAAFVIQALLFAVGASGAFVAVELSARRFDPLSMPSGGRELLLGGALDGVAVLAAVGAAAASARLPGLIAWPAVSFLTTSTFLTMGGLDVLFARRAARRGS